MQPEGPTQISAQQPVTHSDPELQPENQPQPEHPSAAELEPRPGLDLDVDLGAYGPQPWFDASQQRRKRRFLPRRRRITGRKALLLGTVGTVLTVCGIAILWLVREETGTDGFLVGLGLAVLPLPLLILVFLWVDRVEPGPRRNLVFAFAWGACAATLISLLANSAAVVWFVDDNPTASARDTDLWGAAVVAPVVEESAKAAAILLLFLFRRREFRGLVDGVVTSGLVATGFAFTENILYLGRAYYEDQALGDDAPFSITMITFFARAIISPFAHPVFTLMTGIGFGLAALATRRQRLRRVLLPIGGLLLAIFMHALWNGSAVFNPAGFFAVYALFMVPVFALLVWLAVWSRGRELRRIRDELPAYVRAGWVAPAEPMALSSMRARKLARTIANRVHGDAGDRAVAEYEASATRLAMMRDRAGRGWAGDDFAERERELLRRMWERKALAQPALVQAAWAEAPYARAMPAYGAGPAWGVPYAPHGMAPYGMPPQGMPPQGMPPHAMPPHSGPQAWPPPWAAHNGPAPRPSALPQSWALPQGTPPPAQPDLTPQLRNANANGTDAHEAAPSQDDPAHTPDDLGPDPVYALDPPAHTARAAWETRKGGSPRH